MWVNAQPIHPPTPVPAQNRGVDRVKHLGKFRSQTGERNDVEEAAVVQFGVAVPPEREL